MKLAILTLDFLPTVGGVQNYLAEISQRLALEHQLLVITPEKGPDTAQAYCVKTVAPRIFAFFQALCAFRPDRILVGHAHPKLLVAAALVLPRRYAVFVHGNDYLAAQQCWHRPLFNWLLAGASPLVTNSECNAKRLRRLGAGNLPTVVSPGTDPERFHPPLAPVTQPLTLLTTSRLVPRKGIDTTLQALSTLVFEFPKLRYRIVGTGPDRTRLANLAQHLGIAQNIEFLGRVSDEELPRIYQDAHIFVMPAREEPDANSVEGFGIVYLEASASGLPVIVGNSGGAAEAVKDGETGILVPPNNSDALAQALRQLLSDAALRRRMGRAGRRWVENEMNWDCVARKLALALQL